MAGLQREEKKLIEKTPRKSLARWGLVNENLNALKVFRFSNNETEVVVAAKSTGSKTSQLRFKNCSVSWKFISILIFLLVVLLCFGMFAAGFFYGTRYKNRVG